MEDNSKSESKKTFRLYNSKVKLTFGLRQIEFWIAQSRKLIFSYEK